MNGIIYDARRIKAYEGMQALARYAGKLKNSLPTSGNHCFQIKT